MLGRIQEESPTAVTLLIWPRPSAFAISKKSASLHDVRRWATGCNRLMRTRTYSELRRLPSFAERFDYLCLGGEVGQATFGFDRWINQYFYRSQEWQHVRIQVVFRDFACDLGMLGYDI